MCGYRLVGSLYGKLGGLQGQPKESNGLARFAESTLEEVGLPRLTGSGWEFWCEGGLTTTYIK